MKLQQHYFRESTRPPDRHMRVWGLLAIMTWLPNPAFPVEAITVVSYGGSYAQASVEAYHKPFTEATGIEVRLDDFNGGLAQIRAQVDAGAVHWDVVDLATSHVELACNEGIIEIVDLDALAPGVNGEPPTTDFPEDARTECGPGFLYYSTIYAYNTNYIEGSPPETMEDFFDLEKFPGRRGMRREPFANLEFALLADGVPADQIYTVLDAPQGVDRALRKLDTIKDHVVWWEAGAQPPQMLADGEVLMSTGWNGRIFNAQILENQPFVIVWDGQLLDIGGQMAVVAGTPRLEAAMAFVRFVSRPESLANISKYISYSPTRSSAQSLVGKHLQTGIDMHPHMPGSQENLTRAIKSDWRWWAENRDDMNERFSVWLAH